MAEKYIINMPLKTTPDDTDLMIIEDAQDTKRITWANVVKPIEDLVDNAVAAHEAEDVTQGDIPHGMIYEEGTWTAVISGNTTSGTYETLLNMCNYKRIGNHIFLNAFVRLSNPLTGGGSGYLIISGLPFAKKEASNSVGMVKLTNTSYTQGASLCVTFVTTSQTDKMTIQETNSTGIGNSLDVSNISAHAYLNFNIEYSI